MGVPLINLIFQLRIVARLDAGQEVLWDKATLS
jgi:hypothetical protein